MRPGREAPENANRNVNNTLVNKGFNEAGARSPGKRISQQGRMIQPRMLQ